MCKTHTHKHTVQTDRGEEQCCLTEIFGEENCLEFAFEGIESSRVPDILGKIISDVWTESGKTMGFAVEVHVSDEDRREQEGV